jgi:hypothetical protein
MAHKQRFGDTPKHQGVQQKGAEGHILYDVLN